jgi:hypothetical protein
MTIVKRTGEFPKRWNLYFIIFVCSLEITVRKGGREREGKKELQQLLFQCSPA